MRKNGLKNIRVSVIIPVYNAEKYIGQMLESVLGQSLKEIEIICVNDGSSDNSCNIIRSFMKRDSRIMLLEQPKSNAGTARNRGLLKAKGQYVVFWDADDKFDKKALELMHRKMRKKQADICVCRACEFTYTGKVYEAGYLKTAALPDKDPFNKFDICEELFSFATNVAWNKMFRRDFLKEHRLYFQEISQANDTAFVMKALYLADRITCVEKYLVYYRTGNENSLTGKASETFLCPYESYLDRDQLKYTLRRVRRRLAPLFTLNEKIKDVRRLAGKVKNVRRLERKTTGEREKI